MRRIHRLQQAFDQARIEHNYTVATLRSIRSKSISRACGGKYRFAEGIGLEAGSKPELLAILA